MKNLTNDWLTTAEKSITEFSKKHSTTYNKKKREISASFEIGCFHALLRFYETHGFSLHLENLINNEYRYLTTPNGNPSNFSFISITGLDGDYEIRQQVRIKSHLDNDIAFSPDIVVLHKNASISNLKDVDYASGKRPFYSVFSKDVVAAHECKSMTPFPELLVSFIGMFITAHLWANNLIDEKSPLHKDGTHLAPTMFVGGAASALHLRMITSLQKVYPINIIVGLHQGTWDLTGSHKKINKLKFNKSQQKMDTPTIEEIINVELENIPF
ncbi:hypothetical protein [Aeromonas sp. SCS5]|uniref:hypothetical protein n=1 Tax=Aeromonas sp. SCS5 TaxID=1519205 RepID=UPI001177EC2D|nr:hypothetical protein [Aeromonas sp. SCS5]